MLSMDILNTQLVWIEGRCYRKLPIKDSENIEPVEDYSTKKKVIEPEEFRDEECDISDLPIQHDGDRFYVTLPVPASLIGFIQGKKEQTRKKIEEQTTTTIKIPPARKTDNKDVDIDIVIVGRHKENVASAYRRIDFIAKEGRWKVGEYTHFISIPMNVPSIQEGFNRFKKEVLSNYRAQGITESLFESSPKLHLTVAMLTLLNGREKEAAASLLQKYKGEILHVLGGKPLHIEVKGIEYMNDDPSEVDVLYGMVQETDSDNCLQIISDKLAYAFANADLSRKEKGDHVKLHVTLMKSRSTNGMGRETFNASKILQKYADYTFGHMTVREIHISVRFTGGTTYYYTPSFILKI